MEGGAEKLVGSLFQELKQRGHQVQILKIPFKWYPPLKILDSVLIWKLLDLKEYNNEKIDLLISTKFPSYVTEHPNHVVWLPHQHRPAYDLRNTKFDDLQNDPGGEYVRKKIFEIDNKHLKKVKKIFTISKNVSRRLLEFNQIESEALYIPVSNSEKYQNKEYGNYVIYPSRITPLKRQDLLIEAMKHTKSDVKCKIIGFESNKKWVDEIMKSGMNQDKVEVLTNVSDDELIEMYSKSLAVVFLPMDEDYGFVTLEAFYSSKPVITTTDSGGPLEFVKDEENGFVVEPDPKKIAQKLDELYNNKDKTEKMGKMALKTVKDLNLNWDTVIEKLTS